MLYISPVSWNWIKQRPHFLAEKFAERDHEVCFFFYNAMGKIHHTVSNPFPRLTVEERAVLPGSMKIPLIARLNASCLRTRIPWKKYDAVLLTAPKQVLLCPSTSEFKGKIIYDCMDNTPAFFSGKQKVRLQRQEQILCDKADLIIVSSAHLKGCLISSYSVPARKIHIIRNAVKKDFPADSSGVPGEIVYIGTIDSWFDWDTLIQYAYKHPSRKITLIGPCKSKPKSIPGNIILKGCIEHDQVCSHIRGASLLLIPFKVNSLIESVDPVKLYEYLAFGKNVLSAYWEELNHFLPNPHLHFYHSGAEFENLAERLLAGASDKCCIPDKNFIQENCWDARAAEYEQLIKKTE